MGSGGGVIQKGQTGGFPEGFVVTSSVASDHQDDQAVSLRAAALFSGSGRAVFALNVRDEIVFVPQTAAVPAVEVKEGVRQAALERGLESFLSRDIHSLSE